MTTTVPTLPARPEAARARTSRLAHAPLAPRRADRAARGHRRPLHLGPVALRVGQRLLLGRGAGRWGELEGVVLRLVRRRERDHRRQDARGAVGHRAVGADLRAEQLERPRPAGAHGRRVRRAAVRGGQAGRRAGRRADRRRGAGPDPGRGPDLPVQQPGRPARAGADRRGVRDAASRREGRHPVAGAGRGAGRRRLPREDAPGLPRAAGADRGVAARRARRLVAADPGPAARGRRDAGQRGLVGARRGAVARRLAPLHRRLADQQRAGARVRLQRLRPADRRRDRQRRRQPRRWLGADGHHAAVRLRDGRRRLVVVARRARAARGADVAHPRGSPTRRPPRAPRCSGAAGCWSPAWCSATWPGSSTPTTRSRSRRRSPRWSASG